MKHRFSFILAYAALLGMLTLGGAVLLGAPREARISDTENRMLQGFPSLEGDAVLSGRFMEEFEQFLSDGFPRRDRLVGLSQGMLSLLGEKDEEYELQAAIAREERSEIPGEGETPDAPAETGPAALSPAGAPAAESVVSEPPAAGDAVRWLVRPDGMDVCYLADLAS